MFSTHSSDDTDDGGYPGSLNVAMKLELSPISGELKIEYSGMSTKETPIDISNNIFINLAGHKEGKIQWGLNMLYHIYLKFIHFFHIPNIFSLIKGKAGLYDHFVQINAKEYVPSGTESEPVDNIIPVEKSPFDMRLSKHLGRAIFKLPKEGKGKDSLYY